MRAMMRDAVCGGRVGSWTPTLSRSSRRAMIQAYNSEREPPKGSPFMVAGARASSGDTHPPARLHRGVGGTIRGKRYIRPPLRSFVPLYGTVGGPERGKPESRLRTPARSLRADR